MTASTTGLTSPQNNVLAMWRFFTAVPGGRSFFSRMMDRQVPYARSIDQKVEALRPGFSRLAMGDQRSVRNHRRAVHAAAVMNLSENAGGLALASLLADGTEPVLRSASIEHRKAATGPLTAECTVEKLAAANDDQVTEVLVRDQRGHIVAEVRAVWTVQPSVTA